MTEKKFGLLEELADFADRHPQAHSAFLCREALQEIKRLRKALEEIAAYYPRPALTAAQAIVVARNAVPITLGAT